MTALIFLSLLVDIIFLCGFLYLLVRPVIHGAIYFPSGDTSIAAMLRMANMKPGERVADVGSGDGRVLIAFATAGMEAIGYEINPFLVLYSRRAIKKAGVSEKAHVYWKNFWKEDLSTFDVIVIYGFPRIMERFRQKLEKEASSGTKIISNMYHMYGWNPVSSDSTLFCYIKR